MICQFLKPKKFLFQKKVAERLKLEELDYIKFVTPDSLLKPIEVYSLQIAGIFESGSEIDQYLAISSLENVGIIYGIGEKVFGLKINNKKFKISKLKKNLVI